MCKCKRTHFRPSPIAFLHNLRDSPLGGVDALAVAIAVAEDVLDYHGRGESGGDVKDFEVAVSCQSEIHTHRERERGDVHTGERERAKLTMAFRHASPPRLWKIC